jgi:hypothetical protein
MDEHERIDSLFRAAVSAIDAGDEAELERLLAVHPELVRERLCSPGPWLHDKIGAALDGFFQKPYLLWFVAEDPVRNGKLPDNIGRITRKIIEAARREGVASLQEQLDYALQLVSWSWIARECAVQSELIDALVDAGANVEGNPENALVNGNFAAAEHLLRRGATLTLATALCLERWGDVDRLGPAASARDKQLALVLAACKGKADALRRAIELGADVNAPSPDLYPHATPLHHAVSSGSLEAVQVLVQSGAGLNLRDSAWDGTPLGWAEYLGKKHLAAYLREHGAGTIDPSSGIRSAGGGSS